MAANTKGHGIDVICAENNTAQHCALHPLTQMHHDKDPSSIYNSDCDVCVSVCECDYSKTVSQKFFQHFFLDSPGSGDVPFATLDIVRHF